ncbi:MAG: hypothetical protein JWO98_4798 [Frankiales bacterium]|nr:hypothetical protein [Frankiales bacterium]
MTECPEAAQASPPPAVRRSGLLFGGVAVVALAAAVALYAAGGPPYGVNIGGGFLYLLGLLAGLVASVLLWITWSEVRTRVSTGRLRWGVGTAAASLLLVSTCVVVSLSRVAGGQAQLVLITVTAVVLGGAVAAVPRGGG